MKEKIIPIQMKVRVFIYSLWLFLMRRKAIPQYTQLSFILISLLTAIDLLLSSEIAMNLFMKSFVGFTYLYLPVPFLSIIGPTIGCFGCLTGSVFLMKLYSDINATLVVITFAIDLFFAILLNQHVYITLIVTQILLKFFVS